MRRSNAPTLQDVAREAGVTAMAASVVLNGASSSTRVSEASRERILEAAARLKYRRNAAARGLFRRRMDCIGVVAIVDSGDINLYFMEVFNGILQAAAERDQNTTVFSIQRWRAEESRILSFCDGRVDGMILIAPTVTPAFAETLHHFSPLVAIHGSIATPHCRNLDVDNEGGAYAATRYLIGRGHRRIAHFSGGESAGARERLAGYLRAMSEAGIRIGDDSPGRIVPGDFTGHSGSERVARMLESARERNGNRSDAFRRELPTAIFCANDAVALGCMEALRDGGVRVPEDISVVGFDDLLISALTRPALTTVRQPFRQMGSRAVEALLSQIEFGEKGAAAPSPAEDGAAGEVDASVSFAEIFPTELVERESVAPPRS